MRLGDLRQTIVWPDGGNTMTLECPSSYSFDLNSIGPFTGMRAPMPQSPRRHVMTCRHCHVSSMIPDSTDKIMALVCPQCGGALDE